MKVSIVIPCFNEVESIGKILEIVMRVQIVADKEIIIVDDFSTDGTRKYLNSLEKEDSSVKVIYHDKNMGKGATLRTGFKAVTGDVVIIQDADLEYDPNDYIRLLKPIVEDKADVVYGSRFVGGEAHRILFFWHSIGNKLLTLFSNLFTNLNLTDMEVCYKVFRREILDKIELKEDRFGFEPEFTIKISKLKCRIYEVGISYSGRSKGDICHSEIQNIKIASLSYIALLLHPCYI